MTAPKYRCANWSHENTECKEEGRSCCGNCRLVAYCSSTCQKLHWIHHKSECKSPLGRETWLPAWALEGRKPAFIGDGIGTQFGAKKYLWGNVPALDILRHESNEGNDYSGDLRLLFAASGDLRNVIKTVAGIPTTYPGLLDITINDRDPDIVARNVIMLLIALTSEQVNEAVECIIHIWYSAFVRESDMHVLQSRIRPLIEDICGKIKDKTTEKGKLFAKTWTFKRCSLRVILEKPSWMHLLSCLSKPAGLSPKQAHKIRADTTLAESRRDYRERYMYCLSPFHRIAFDKFRQDGLLLPFGFPRHEFREPNPTFFQDRDIWPMKDNADPLGGWSVADLANTPGVPAKADIYGKLFYYIHGLLRSFLDRLSVLRISFKNFQVDMSLLRNHIEEATLSRIEVSNVADPGWVGIHWTLGWMIPLLQTPLENPHAPLITLFLNAVEATLTEQDRLQDLKKHSAVTQSLFKYLPPKRMPTSQNDPELIKFNFARDFVTTYDQVFDRYLRNFKVDEIANFIEAKMKNKHTIIEEWPYRLKLRPGQPGAQDEFDRLLSSGLSGKERYIKWTRAHHD